MGLERIDGIWTWFDGRIYPSDVGYGLWDPFDPNDDEDCAMFKTANGEIIDEHCGYIRQYVCMLQ